MNGFPRSTCVATIYSSVFDRPFAFAHEEAATRRILWLTSCEAEGIAGVLRASGVPTPGSPLPLFGADHNAEHLDPASVLGRRSAHLCEDDPAAIILILSEERSRRD